MKIMKIVSLFIFFFTISLKSMNHSLIFNTYVFKKYFSDLVYEIGNDKAESQLNKFYEFIGKQDLSKKEDIFKIPELLGLSSEFGNKFLKALINDSPLPFGGWPYTEEEKKKVEIIMRLYDSGKQENNPKKIAQAYTELIKIQSNYIKNFSKVLFFECLPDEMLNKIKKEISSIELKNILKAIDNQNFEESSKEFYKIINSYYFNRLYSYLVLKEGKTNIQVKITQFIGLYNRENNYEKIIEGIKACFQLKNYDKKDLAIFYLGRISHEIKSSTEFGFWPYFPEDQKKILDIKLMYESGIKERNAEKIARSILDLNKIRSKYITYLPICMTSCSGLFREVYQIKILANDSDSNTIILFDWITDNDNCESVVQIVNLIAKFNVDVNSRNRLNETPLHVAVQVCNLPAVRILLSLNANVNLVNMFGCTPLQEALNLDISQRKQKDLNEIIKLLIPTSNLEIESHYHFNRIALHFAASKFADNTEIIQALLKKGTKINKQDSMGYTPLFCAIANGNIEIVKLLLNKKADANIKNFQGNLPLHEAVRIASSRPALGIALIKLLIPHTKNINEKNNNGDTALHLSVDIYRNFEVFKLLIEHGIDIYEKNHYGANIVKLAQQCKNDPVIDYVKKHVERFKTIKSSTNRLPSYIVSTINDYIGND